MKSIYRIFQNMKLRRKLLLTYFLVSILPITILGGFCFGQTKVLLEEREKNSLQESINKMQNDLENQIHVYNNLSDYIAFNQTITQVINYEYRQNYYDMYDKFTTLLDPLLASLQYFHSDVLQVTIYTANDIVEHGKTIAPMSKIMDKTWYYDTIKDSKVHWYVNPGGETFMTRSIPKLNENSMDGILYIAIDYNYLFSNFSSIVGDNYGVACIDQDKNVIYKNEVFDKESEYHIDSYALSKLSEGDQLVDNIPYAIITEDITENGWMLYMYKPLNLMSESANQIAITVILIIFTCLIIVFVIAKVMSYLILYRLERLMDNMKQVEEGNLNVVTTDSNAQDEVGNLVRGFDTMIGQIKVLIDEVYESEISRKEYEMRALQAQINPHFLYNALSLINWKAIRADAPDISKVTLLLSTFYRTALNKGKNRILLKDEVSNMKSYVEIQLIMHDYNFDVDIQIDDRLLEIPMPNLLLQPLVENAIGHGIDLKESGRGKLTIAGILVGDMVIFEVNDNGVGMSDEIVTSLLTTKTKGYGLRNVNERIKLTYGEEYALQIKSIEGHGTTITMRFPANHEISD